MRLLLALLLLTTGCDVKTVISRPLGRITVPNEYGQYPPGAFEIATNVAMRDPGVLSSLPALRSYRDNAFGTDTARKVWCGDAYQLVISQNGGTWAMRWVNAAGPSSISSPSAFSHSFSTGIAPVARQRDRTIVGTANGPIVLDSETDTTARTPGFSKPLVVFEGSTVAADAVVNGNCASYRAVYRRKFSDGYEVTGPPSESMRYANATGANVGPRLLITIEGNSGAIAGDLIDVYRTEGMPSAADPGDTHYLVSSVAISSANVTAGYVLLYDRVPDDNLGAELYGNPGQDSLPGGGGPLRYKARPPLARDIVVHGDHVLYLGTTTPASLRAYVPHTWGALTTAIDRQYGIGSRTFTADSTLGSPTLTNISTADMVGLAVGQRVRNAATLNPSATAYVLITAVGANSITLDSNATATVVGSAGYVSYDMMTIGGERVIARNYTEFSFLATHPSAGAFGYPSAGRTQAFEIRSANTRVSTLVTSDSGVDFFISRQHAYEGSFTLQASNGANYQPAIADYSGAAQTVSPEAKLNRVHWAEKAQPEAVPSANTFLVGNSEIYRGVYVGDGITLVFASDGLWQVRGDGINGWAVERKDPKLFLAARGAVDVMGGLAWAYTNRGLVSITPAGDVTEISTPIIGGRAKYSDTWDVRLAADDDHHEIWYATADGTVLDVYNERTGAFTQFSGSRSVLTTGNIGALAYSKGLSSIVFAVNGANTPLLYFEDDTSNLRIAGASVRQQPLVGDEPTSLKEWMSTTYVFDGFPLGAVLTPTFNGVFYADHAVPANANESRLVVDVPNDAPSYSEALRVGFEFTSGATTQLWTLRTIAVRYRLVNEDGVPR